MNELSEEKKKEFDSYYKSLQLPNCSKCGINSEVIPTTHGRPTKELYLYSELGHVKLGSCTRSYKGWCKKCKEFIE